MKLYDWSPAPNPRRVRIFLLEKGIDIPIVDVGDDQMRLSADYIRRYPEALVPMLELDNGVQIGEAMVICRYLESLFPDPPLLGADPLDQAMVDMWERRAWIQGMLPASEVFRNTHPDFIDRSLPGYDLPLPQIPALVERGTVNLGLFFDKFDTLLDGSKFLTGDGYTMADATALCVIDFAAVSKIEIPEGFANLRRWYHDVSQRPSSALSLQRAGE